MAQGGQGGGVAHLGLNATQYLAAMGQVAQANQNVNQTVQQLIGSFNQLQGAATRAGGGAANLNVQIGLLNGNLATLNGIAVAQSVYRLYQSFASATKEAAEFSRSIGLIQTISADAGMSYSQWADGIRRVSDELGTPLAETSAAAYDLLSNQVTKAADTFDTLGTAANLAKLTNASVTDSVNTLSSAINAYGYTSADTEQLAAKLFTTVDLGRVKLNELANTAGRVFETGKAVGVTFEEVNAGLVAITQTGVKTDTAMTLLNNLFSKLLKPTKELQAVYDELGVGTGDAFVKLNGLSGVLEILRQRTNGSAAALSKYLPELRGFQAAQILLDNSKGFIDGLREQDAALERSRKALETYNETPGAKLQVQIQQLENDLTTGLKTELLEGVLEITESFGGLKETAMGLLRIVGLIGGGIVGWQASIAASSVAAAGLGATLAPLAAPLAAATVTAALTQQIMLWQQQRYEIEHVSDAIRQYYNEVARKNQADDDKARARDIQETKAALDKKLKLTLDAFASQRQAQTQINTAVGIENERLQAKLKNSVELSLGSAKDSLRALNTQLTNALSNIQDARKANKSVGLDRGDALLNFRLAEDTARTGGENEQRILGDRLDELNRQRARAARRGDKQGFDAADQRAESLINQMATATNQFGGLKYFGQEQAINEFYAQRVKYNNQIAATNERIAASLNKQKAELSAQVKDAEDAGADLYKFSLTDKKGNQLFGSEAELNAALSKVYADFQKKMAVIQANPNANQFRGADAIAAQDLLARRMQTIRQDFLNSAKGLGVQQRGINAEQAIDAARMSAEKITEAAIKRINEVADRASKSGLEAGYASSKLKESLSGILASDGIVPKDLPFRPNPAGADFEKQRDALVGGITESARKQDFPAAFSQLGNLEALLQKLATFREPVMTAGPRTNGELNNPTPESAVQQIRADLNSLQEASGRAAAANKAFAEISDAPLAALDRMNATAAKWKEFDAAAGTLTTERVNQATAAMNQAIEQIGAALDRAQALARGTIAAPVANKSGGGFAGYFAAGGEPRGIDTTLVRMSPDEFIVNPQASARFRSQLIAMNQGLDPGSRSNSTNVGDIHVNVSGGSSSQQTLNEIAAGLRRGIRQGTIRLT